MTAVKKKKSNSEERNKKSREAINYIISRMSRSRLQFVNIILQANEFTEQH
jgi:hypothetical protein